MSFSSPMTREKMEALGHHTRGTYRGPLSWHYCMELYEDLQQARREDGTHVFRVGSLFIVSQGEGYNIVYLLTEQEYQQSLGQDPGVNTKTLEPLRKYNEKTTR